MSDIKISIKNDKSKDYSKDLDYIRRQVTSGLSDEVLSELRSIKKSVNKDPDFSMLENMLKSLSRKMDFMESMMDKKERPMIHRMSPPDNSELSKAIRESADRVLKAIKANSPKDITKGLDAIEDKLDRKLGKMGLSKVFYVNVNKPSKTLVPYPA